VSEQNTSCYDGATTATAIAHLVRHGRATTIQGKEIQTIGMDPNGDQKPDSRTDSLARVLLQKLNDQSAAGFAYRELKAKAEPRVRYIVHCVDVA
jgi:hypothetical protein